MSVPLHTSSIYSLTWGDYGTSLVSAVQLLRCHGDLVDVTLAAGGRSFPAHKIVLCAASPFLLDLLKNTPCKHPVVMLAGVNANDLEALLEFVYRGEVSVDHSQLPSLLQAAHCLNIQGLAPQTSIQNDDPTKYTTTSIQLHPIVQPHQMKTVIDVGGQHYTVNDTDDQLITVQAAPTQTVQAEVVEDIAHLSEEVTKDVISQFLPQRKRKPRAKKSDQASKVPKLDDPNISQMAGSTVTVQTTQPQTSENGIPTLTTIKTEKTDAANGGGQPKMEGAPPGTIPAKPKAKSQSEQPATCPICSAVIRQSRNLRRHLELRHFKKPGPKKSRKSQQNQQQAQQPGIKQEIIDNTAEASTSAQGQTIVTVTSAPNQLGEATITTAPQQVVMSENPDGTTSLSIAHVQTLSGQTLSLANLNQATILRTEDGLESGMITTHEGGAQRQPELLRYGNTIYTIEERPADS